MTDAFDYETTDGTYDSILVPTDGSDPAGRAARHGVGLAAQFDATLHALHVVDERQYSSHIADADAVAREQEGRLKEVGEDAVASVAELADEADVETVTEVVTDVPFEGILDYVDDNDIDLVAMGTHGRTGFERVVLGSVAERVLRHATVPVLNLRDAEATTPTAYEDVLVATDGREGVGPAVEHALTVAERYDATVHALFVVDVRNVLVDEEYGPFTRANVTAMEALSDLGQRATDAVVRAGSERGVEVTAAVEEGVPARTILDVADERDADVIAMGTHGRSGLERYLVGSVTESVLRHADQPVLTVRRADVEE
ncbi:universal stress protein [Halomicrococcus gelatinilyticus]|uniref:universal stress protein n=1 Tax=Halomicrococcus gelatinilyticus TaxID=1702103 RepID=UPI002E0FFCBF